MNKLKLAGLKTEGVKFKTFLLLCGPSGSGKTYVEKLLTGYSDEHVSFNKLRQVTTRSPRSQEEIDNKVYEFITKQEYETIKDDLFARTEHNGHLYGTKLSDAKDSVTTIECINDDFCKHNVNVVVNTAVVNAGGIDDFKQYVKNNLSDEHVRCMVIYIESDSLESRSDRDNEFISKERQELKGKWDICLLNNADNRLTAQDVVKALIKQRFL